MKMILKASALAVLLAVSSCAHHGKCHGGAEKSQCSMKDGKACCADKSQCPMKTEEAKAAPAAEVKK